MDARRLLTRYTVCKVANHKWVKTAYPGSEGSAYFLRCRRCGKEDHQYTPGGEGRGLGIFIGGPG